MPVPNDTDQRNRMTTFPTNPNDQMLADIARHLDEVQAKLHDR